MLKTKQQEDICILTGKGKYFNEKDAWTMAGHIAMTQEKYLTVYKCSCCNTWHLTHRRF